MPFLVRQSALVAFLLAAWLAASPSVKAQEPVWHYSPYQIRVWTALAPAAELNAALEQRLLRTLQERSEAVALAPWTVQAEPAPAVLQGAMLAGLKWLTTEQLLPPEETPAPASASTAAKSTAALSAGASSSSSDAPASAEPPLNGGASAPEAPSPPPDFTDVVQKHDKLMLLRVAPDRGGFLIEARELDCRTRQWSEVVSRHAAHASLVPLEAFRAVEAAFRPLVRIEWVKGSSATVRQRAGGLIENEHSPAFLSDDTVLLPVVRFNDRHGKPRRDGIQIAPWAYLTLKERVGAGRLECELIAGVATALGARSGSRIEKYGLAVTPRHDATTMTIRARPASPKDPEPTEPLVGYEIHERLPGAEELAFVGRTDWRGQVDIGKSDHPVRVLYVKNGSRLLAKFPVAPGFLPHVDVNVMNDDHRLEVEGFIAGLQGRIMDLVVAREVLALRIRKRIQDQKFVEAEALLIELRGLPSRDQIQAELDQEAARQRLLPADRATKAAIDKLFADTRAMIAKYLDNTLPQKLDRELQQARPAGA